MEPEQSVLGRQQMQLFAEDGYMVVPQLVLRDLIAAARQELQAQITREPPPAEHRGPRFYLLTGPSPPGRSAILP